VDENQKKTGYISSEKARIYYEQNGTGISLIMIHAGVADSRQWNNEFQRFSQDFQAVRYDIRGYGKSNPVDGVFTHLGDLTTLIEALEINPPYILMGCSMGGGLAMDYALANPEKVAALIMVGSGPSGLVLDVEEPEIFSDAAKAFEDGDLDLLAEIETQIWFVGMDRTRDQVDPKMHQLAFDMNRTAIGHEVKQLGQRQADTDKPAYERLEEINSPLLIIVGSQDIPYMHAAANYMMEIVDSAQKIIIQNAAHLPNMDQPEQFFRIVSRFLADLSI